MELLNLPAVPGSVAVVSIGTSTIDVDVADTKALQERGLSGRASLPEGKGMLFVFDKEYRWGIWMKDMKFPTDIIWADKSGSIVTIEHSVAPNTYPETFYPGRDALYVLEVPSGYAKAHDIKEGGVLKIDLNI